MEDFKGMRPVCPHSAYCGGCIYQGVPYEQQLAEKEREVHRLLEEKNVHPVRIDAIAGCPTPYAYRNKMGIYLRRFCKGRAAGARYAPQKEFHVDRDGGRMPAGASGF